MAERFTEIDRATWAALAPLTGDVSDLPASRTLFTAFLGTEPYADAPYYVGYRPGTGPEIGLDPNARPGQGPMCYSDVRDIQAALEKLIAAGATAACDRT